MRTTSLTRRAIVTVVVVEFLCALAISTTALWHERWTRFRSFDAMLAGRTDSLLGAVQDSEDAEANVRIDPEEFTPAKGDLYAVYNPEGRLLGSSPQALPALAFKPRDEYSTFRIDHHEYRLLQRQGLRVIDREETNGVGLRRPVITLYAARTDFIWRDIYSAARFYALITFILLCLTTAILIVLLRRILQPLRELAASASAIDARSLSFEPPASALRLKESKPLADALSAAIARLRYAFEMQHRFVGDASHELKTGVAVVRSSLQVMTMRPRFAEEYELGIERVLNDNKRVEELVSRMLTLARFEEREAIESVEVNLAESVERTLRNLSTFAEAHSVSLVATVNPHVRVWMTAEGADVLVSNLVMNAIQHSTENGIVQVSLSRTDETSNISASAVLLKIKDSGLGVAADKLPHLFERFYRADPSRSRQTGGAGLGLAICKSIVEAAGGSIMIQSEQGQGTVVTVTFPISPVRECSTWNTFG